MEEETKLHWLRTREKDSNDPFSDPYADITRVTPSVIKDLVTLYESYDKGNPDIDYLKAVFSVFFTRLEEDSASLSKQLEEFLKAYTQLPKDVLEVFQADFTAFILILTALYLRRDRKADKEETKNIRLSAAYLFMQQYLKEETCTAIEAELGDRLKPAIKKEPQEASVGATCVETGEHIDDIKDIAARMIGATGKQDWDSVSAACDKLLNETEDTSKETVATALAYPSYKAPYFEVEVDNESGAAKQGSDSQTV